ncbi:LysR family transcriptional regulator [Ramlibacter sp. 2FC]|uniref:LysR family transcriptional regulator n=1 Tax=Ramlibacter sp. 2FC TaxID=2502188 RepID=UPI0010F9FFA2|nr:LysR family transcriptional regulator [Ramlibacter sp. 2FC]
MQLQLQDVALFARIAELGSLSAAARERNVPVSQVTRALARLEAACGLRLLNRSTHGLSLTDEGDIFLAYGQRLLDVSAELASELSGKISGPSGWVRVSVSPLLAQTVIAPSLPSLYERHPQLHVDINADDRIADMAREGIDIAIRTGTPSSDTVVAREIGSYTRTLYASPAYLTRFGTPRHPDDLRQHRLLANSVSPQLNRWPLTDREDRRGGELQVQGHTRTDNSAVMLSLVQHGVGIARLMDLLARPLVQDGALVPLLQDSMAGPRVTIYAVMPRQRQRLPKIRACMDHWTQWLADMARR